MKNKLGYLSLISLTFCLTACPFRFSDGGAWKNRFGTPELLLENASDECYFYLYEDESQYFKDYENKLRESIKDAAPFESSDNHSVPNDIRYFTFQASWVPATSGPNIDRLSIWENGFVRIHHKSSLGPHAYEYFSIDEAKALELVDFVFSTIESNK